MTTALAEAGFAVTAHTIGVVSQSGSEGAARPPADPR